MKLPASVLALFFILISSVTVFAQGQPAPRLSPEDERKVIDALRNQPLNGFFSLTFAYSSPMGAFKDALTADSGKTTGLGFGINGGYRMSNIPLEFGINADFQFYGGSTKYFPKKTLVGTISRDVNDTLDISNMMIPVSLFARVAPRFGIVEPYVEVHAGLNFIRASNELKIFNKSPDIVTKTSAPFFYGAGAGISFRIAEIIEMPDSRQEILFTLGTSYRVGASTTYSVYKLDETTNEVIERQLSSKTDLLVVNAGIMFRF
ncbi:MAG: outer membrane beta-barrel protein [Candidatus Kapabacteria bacterium]|nr:outer membrane beta-barrel protein [Candidatus Kapabacteria bacterium]